MSEESDEKFRVRYLYESFLASMQDRDDIILRHYLESYTELLKVFNLLGAVFGLIGSDVKSKIDLLYGYLVDEGRINFVTVKTMMEYETENDLLNKKGYVSGCRTLLRLNRVLNFIRELLRRVGQLEPLDNTNSACQEAYDQTLALYHPHLLQKGTRMAMLTLPTRNQLLYRVIANDDEAVQRDVAVFPVMNTIIGKVYTRVQNLYTIMDLHSLP